VIKRCYHSGSDLFGVWPANIRAAAHYGYFGATELFRSLEDACELVQQGYPVIASIAFKEGALQGSPLTSTRGHLVVVRGFCNGQVFVNDPAAATHETVTRSYDANEFSAAWLGHQGLGYILVPRQKL